MRPKIWTDDVIDKFCKDHDLGITMMQTPVNMKSVVTFRCDKCGHRFKSTFDCIYRNTVVNKRKKGRPYIPCQPCRFIARADKAVVPDHHTPDGIWMAGVVAARGSILDASQGGKFRNTCFSISSRHRHVVDRVAAISGAEAKPKVEAGVCGSTYSLNIRSSRFVRAAAKMPAVPPRDETLARLWTRGYFDVRGVPEMYDSGVRRVTVSGEGDTLSGILKSYRRHTGEDTGHILTHCRYNKHYRRSVSTTELHFSGLHSCMKFLEWIHSPPCGKPSRETARLMANIGKEIEMRKKSRARVWAAAKDAAGAVVMARRMAVSHLIEKTGVKPILGYAAAYGIVPEGLSHSLAGRFRAARSNKVAYRRKAYGIVSSAARAEGLSMSTVMGKARMIAKSRLALGRRPKRA